MEGRHKVEVERGEGRRRLAMKRWPSARVTGQMRSMSAKSRFGLVREVAAPHGHHNERNPDLKTA